MTEHPVVSRPEPLTTEEEALDAALDALSRSNIDFVHRVTLRVLAERAVHDRGADPLREAVQTALNELGVPNEDYPAPVANAVAILRAALGEEPHG